MRGAGKKRVGPTHNQPLDKDLLGYFEINDDARDVYYAIAMRSDPARDMFVVPNTRGSLYDPSAQPLDGHGPSRIVGKIGIDATAKPRHDSKDFERAWPRNWGKVKLENYLS